MKKYIIIPVFLIVQFLSAFAQEQQIKLETIAPGVIKMTMGKSDQFSPYQFCAEQPRIEEMAGLSSKELPFDLKSVRIIKNNRGIQVSLPLTSDEQLYGFGMQIGSFEQRGLKKKPIVNDAPVFVNNNPLANIGYTHAPQPFYVSTRGYGVLINTSRFVTFLCGTNEEKQDLNTVDKNQNKLKFSTDQLYQNQPQETWNMWIDIPNTEGVEILFFQGEDIKECVQRYNLFSGGGAMPPLWGLGIKYRVKGDYTQDKVMKMASYFRDNNIPCDVLGLEPGWHTKAYSCSYVWSDKFPKPQEMIDNLNKENFRLNLWEHAYVNPAAPFFNEMKPYSGNFLVWRGLVPDFVNPKARQIFADYHDNELIGKGIASFKLDECDAGNMMDATSTWGFPEMSQFPSGIDGEQMRQLFGYLYTKTLFEAYKKRNQRTWMDYRASYLFSSSLPAVIYSDNYGHNEYISQVSTSSFGGILWSPELRDAASDADMIRRLQTALLSSQVVINAWYLEHVPWYQINTEKNNKNIQSESYPKLENIVRQLFQQRMALIPYLYSAFADYHFKGIPPFRALIMDYPNDEKVRSISNQYMVGQNLMATPTTADSTTRKVYFPEGDWYDLYSEKQYQGGKSYKIEFPMDQLPLFAKAGSIIPLAEPLNYIANDAVFNITCKVFGNKPSSFALWEDDGTSFDFEKGNFNQINLSVEGGKGTVKKDGKYDGKRYVVNEWNFVK
jgi:alpha-D-xyloside xylohydrolase